MANLLPNSSNFGQSAFLKFHPFAGLVGTALVDAVDLVIYSQFVT